jgi:Holliday junction resolvase RusA-like endonuclease
MISFFVPGVPTPKGSAKGFYIKALDRVVITQDNGAKQKPWASMIAVIAQDLFSKPIEGPVMISMAFRMPRLKGHFGSGKNAGVVKATAPVYHVSKPDCDKLQRCVWDALTGIAWKDDSQVAIVAHASKKYGDNPGVFIKISEIAGGI